MQSDQTTQSCDDDLKQKSYTLMQIFSTYFPAVAISQEQQVQ